MTTDLNFWVMPNAGFGTRAILERHIAEFERMYPNIRVRLRIHPWSLAWNRLMEVVKNRPNGPLPDVIQVGTTWVPTLAHLGALVEVPDANVLPQNDVSAYIWDPGNQSETGHEFYCVPWFIDVRVLYYRKDLFSRLALTKDSVRDWHSFSSACGTIATHLKKSGMKNSFVAPLAFSGQKLGVLMHDLAPWVWAAGGDFCSADLKEATLLQNAFIKGSEFFFNLVNNGHMPLRDTAVSAGNFFTGHFAMQFSGSWPLDGYLRASSPYANPEVANNFDVAVFPAGPQGRYSFLGGSNLAVAAASPNKPAAWDFVRFMGDPDRQLRHARAIGALPARIASLDELFVDFPSAKRVFLESFGFARRLPRLIELGSVERIIYDMSTRVLALIRSREYSPKHLREIILWANTEVNTVLSLHGYGAKAVPAAPL